MQILVPLILTLQSSAQLLSSAGRRDDTNETFIVTGTPGIGKTALLVFIIAAFAKNPKYRFLVHYSPRLYAYLSRFDLQKVYCFDLQQPSCPT